MVLVANVSKQGGKAARDKEPFRAQRTQSVD